MSKKKTQVNLSSTWNLLRGIKPWWQVFWAYLRLADMQSQLFELRASGIQFRTRNGLDLINIKEIFFDRIYERLGAIIGDGWTIIDIGGGIGDFTIYAASKHPNNIVYTFEPDPEAFSLLRENLRLNNINNAQAFPQAILSFSGRVRSHPSRKETSTSIKHQECAASPTGEEFTTTSISLADAFDHIGLAHCNLLKMDCRGAEQEILQHAPDEILGLTERIIIQYHENSHPNIHMTIQEFLTSKGFGVKTYPNVTKSRSGYVFASR